MVRQLVFATVWLGLVGLFEVLASENPGEDVFFMDCQGHVTDESVKKALKALEEHTLFVTVLGSYPEAD